MLIEVKVPALSESIAEATLINWHKQQGEYVERGENLIDIETDKVVLELPAPQSGILAEIIRNDGATVTSGEIIARIDTAAKETKTAAQQPAPIDSGHLEITESTVASIHPAQPLMPSAKKAAEENGLTMEEIAAIHGTGRGGRITRQDVLTHVRNKNSGVTNQQPDPRTDQSADVPQADTSPTTVGQTEKSGRLEKRVPMTRLRMRIAERLVQSQSTAAILTTFNEVNMQPVMDLRKKYQERFEKEHGVRLGFMSFFVKAAVHALKKFPVVNASVDGSDIVYHGYFDIGIAVASPRGLVVPIIRDADQLSLADIEKRIADFGKRAQEGKLAIEELTGGTFSISNGGVFGSMLSTPILNPPQSAILGVHATKERAVVENGQIVVRPMNYLALSYDHRIIDGREAVLSLVAIKDALEDPARLLLDL
ncbi:MAG: 2-oxoglutarate dehydrogenase complex dihydrolipoyllysine-residue succinyltransferase [Nitrosomonas sp.]|nr:2-oxoglutarate dehydrogenase complex dihydrolipoyllysine-residue succinyltransferase [Nitrosomonas sp.]